MVLHIVLGAAPNFNMITDNIRNSFNNEDENGIKRWYKYITGFEFFDKKTKMGYIDECIKVFIDFVFNRIAIYVHNFYPENADDFI